METVGAVKADLEVHRDFLLLGHLGESEMFFL